MALLEVVFLACQKEQLRGKHRNAGQKVLRQAWHRSVLGETDKQFLISCSEVEQEGGREMGEGDRTESKSNLCR